MLRLRRIEAATGGFAFTARKRTRPRELSRESFLQRWNIERPSNETKRWQHKARASPPTAKGGACEFPKMASRGYFVTFRRINRFAAEGLAAVSVTVTVSTVVPLTDVDPAFIQLMPS